MVGKILSFLLSALVGLGWLWLAAGCRASTSTPTRSVSLLTSKTAAPLISSRTPGVQSPTALNPPADTLAPKPATDLPPTRVSNPTNTPGATSEAIATLPSSATFTPQPLKLQSPPMQGAGVSQVQQRLMDLGYTEVGRVDGVYSAQTELAVRHFQYMSKLTVSGEFDQQTRITLFGSATRALSTPPPFPGLILREGAPLHDDQALHARLAELKYIAQDEREWIQERFGPSTRLAVERFQQANRLEPDGTVDLKTWGVLFSPWAIAADGQSKLSVQSTSEWQTTIFPIARNPVALAHDGQRLWIAYSQGSAYRDNFIQSIDPAAGLLNQTASLLMGREDPASSYTIGGMLSVRGRLWLLFPEARPDTSTPAIRTLQPANGAVGNPFEFASCQEGYCFPSSAFGFDGSLVWASAGDRAFGIHPDNYRASGSRPLGWFASGTMVFDGQCMWMAGEAGLAAFNVQGGRCPGSEIAYSLPNDALAFDGKWLWAADSWGGTLARMETKTGAILEPLEVGGTPSALAFGGQRLWIADQSAGTITGLDTESGSRGEPIQVCHGPEILLYAGQRLWVVCTRSQNLQILDLSGYDIPKITPPPTLSPTPTFTRTPTPPPLSRELRLTSPRLEGNDVLRLQQRLLELGYNEVGTPDGVFGPMTEQAVRHFQQVNNLVVDGIVGQITWKALFSPDAKSP